jgi:hypothetical protein
MQIQKGAIVNEYGFFTVLAKVNDTLVFQVWHSNLKDSAEGRGFYYPQFVVTLEVSQMN